MKRCAWFTDTHLDRAWQFTLHDRLLKRINELEVDAVFLTGDISSGDQIERTLVHLARNTSAHIHFVLGNHDYHRRSMRDVDQNVGELVSQHPNLHWATHEQPVTLVPGIGLVGTEGWCDATMGYRWWMRMTLDHFLIEEYSRLKYAAWIRRFHQHALLDARRFEPKLHLALEQHDHVYVLTHFPPWDRAIKHSRLKHFWTAYDVNRALGDAIDRAVMHHPKKRITVLCGHTHDATETTKGNVTCIVGHARSRHPLDSERVILVDQREQVVEVTQGPGLPLVGLDQVPA